MKAIGVRAEQKGRTHGRYRPAKPDKPKSPCQQGAVHTWDFAAVVRLRMSMSRVDIGTPSNG